MEVSLARIAAAQVLFGIRDDLSTSATRPPPALHRQRAGCGVGGACAVVATVGVRFGVRAYLQGAGAWVG